MSNPTWQCTWIWEGGLRLGASPRDVSILGCGRLRLDASLQVLQPVTFGILAAASTIQFMVSGWEEATAAGRVPPNVLPDRRLGFLAVASVMCDVAWVR